MTQSTSYFSYEAIINSLLNKLELGILIIDSDFQIIEKKGQLFTNLFLSSDRLRLSLLEMFPNLPAEWIKIKLSDRNLATRITTPKFAHPVDENSSLFFRLHFDATAVFPYYLVICEEATEAGELEEALRHSYEEIHLLQAKMDHTTARLSRLLERFMPAKVAQKIIHDEEVPFPGSHDVRNCTILFTDMRNFTAFAEEVSPEETVSVLNKYFAVMSETIEKYEGSIVQLIGDLLMAIFNVPDDQPDHARRACFAALEIRENLERFRERSQSSLPNLGFGMGIGTGLVTPSYIGAKNRFQFAAVGDVTNVAYHLCSKAKVNQIIIAQSTLKSAQMHSTLVHATPLGAFQLKRRKRPLSAYELINIT